jgi:hypothetical protein
MFTVCCSANRSPVQSILKTICIAVRAQRLEIVISPYSATPMSSTGQFAFDGLAVKRVSLLGCHRPEREAAGILRDAKMSQSESTVIEPLNTAEVARCSGNRGSWTGGFAYSTWFVHWHWRDRPQRPRRRAGLRLQIDSDASNGARRVKTDKLVEFPEDPNQVSGILQVRICATLKAKS